jgi:hypothetical protein
VEAERQTDKRQRICILGDSLILGALGESLKRGGQYDLTRMALPEDVREMDPGSADAILFDLETTRAETFLSLQEGDSQLLIVGVSAEANLVRMWVGRQLRELSMQGLMNEIRDRLVQDQTKGGGRT